MTARALAMVSVLLCAAAPHAQAPPALDDVLERMRAYLEDYAEQLPATIATESYEQRVGSATRYQLRRLKSEYGIIRVSGDVEWLGFREVQAVDGKPVTDSAARLEALLSNPSVQALQQARLLAQESARYNIGPIYRTVNDPAFVLEVLDGRNARRMKFSKNGETSIAGVRVWIVKLEETAKPTIIRGRGEDDQPGTGARLDRAGIGTDCPRRSDDPGRPRGGKFHRHHRRAVPAGPGTGTLGAVEDAGEVPELTESGHDCLRRSRLHPLPQIYC